MDESEPPPVVKRVSTGQKGRPSTGPRSKEFRRTMSMLEAEQSLGHQILHHKVTEAFFGICILFNLVLVIIETDVHAANEDVSLWIEVVGWLILAIFAFELGWRIVVLKREFFNDCFNIFDTLLVLVDLTLNIASLFAGQLLPVSFLRIVRLTKVSRLAKAFRLFPELRLMMAGLVGSMKAIFWGTVVLAFFLIGWSIVAVQFIHPLNEEITRKGVYDGNCERCPRGYSTVFQAALTFCQQIIAGDSWGLMSVTVIEHYPVSAIFYAAVFLSVGLALLNLILGVVVDVASQSRQQMIEDMYQETLIKRMEAQVHLDSICSALDKDGNGNITREELDLEYKENAEFRDCMTQMNISADDLKVLWSILDGDTSGNVSSATFVSRCYELKSSDSNFMLAYIKYYLTEIKKQICAGIDDVKDDVEHLDHNIEHLDHNMCQYTNAVGELGPLSSANPSKTFTLLSRTGSPTIPLNLGYSGSSMGLEVLNEQNQADDPFSSSKGMLDFIAAELNVLTLNLEKMSDRVAIEIPPQESPTNDDVSRCSENKPLQPNQTKQVEAEQEFQSEHSDHRRSSGQLKDMVASLNAIKHQVGLVASNHTTSKVKLRSARSGNEHRQLARTSHSTIVAC